MLILLRLGEKLVRVSRLAPLAPVLASGAVGAAICTRPSSLGAAL